MPGRSGYEDVQEATHNARDDWSAEFIQRLMWVLIPVLIGGVISMFSDVKQDVQIIIWSVMFIIVAFGLWTHNAKVIRRKRDAVEKERWENLSKGFDKRCGKLHERFDEMDKRFNEIDERFDKSEKANRALLRNELVKMHREWVEKRGYITLETLEYVDKIHDAYNEVDGNDTGDQLWKDLHSIPVKEREHI